MSNEQIDEIVSGLLASGEHGSVVFKEVEGQQPGQRETVGTCPFCGKEQHFYFSNEQPVYYCQKCKTSGNWFTYLKEKAGLEFREALEELARAAGVELEGYNPEAYQKRQRERSLFEAAQKVFNALLWEPEGEPALNYLRSRGISDEDIRAMREEIGAYPGQGLLIQKLKEMGYEEREVSQAGLLLKTRKGEELGKTHQLTIAWRDRTGQITGYQARTLLPEDEQKEKGWSKYLNTLGLSKSRALAGFQRARGFEKVVVVESPIDSALLQAKGYRAVIATGGSSLSDTQLSFLQETGTKELYLALDKDKPGQAGVENILKVLPKGEIKAYVPLWDERHKDPGELVTQNGLEAFELALGLSEPAPAWLARRIISKHDQLTEIGRDRAIREALHTLRSFEGLAAKDFQRALCSELELGIEDLSLEFAKVEELAREEKAKEKFGELTQKAQRLLKEGALAGLEELLETGLQDIRAARGATNQEPLLISELEDYIVNQPPALSTGYPKLDEIALIPQAAITLIAGRPKHGKTTLMLNLLAKQLQIYPDKTFYFYTYEEPAPILAFKLIMLLSGVVIEEKHNQNAFMNYWKYKRPAGEFIPKIEEAIQQYDEWASSERLILVSRRLRAEDLSGQLAYIAQSGDVGAVYIDYIQKIPIREPIKTGLRYLEIKRASELILEQAVQTGLPIILGAQFNRPPKGSKLYKPQLSDLREGGDLEQDVNLCLRVYNEARDKIDTKEEGEPEELPREVDLEITTLANRGGPPGHKITLYFDQPALQINEKRNVQKIVKNLSY